jgi:hypothetical protein
MAVSFRAVSNIVSMDQMRALEAFSLEQHRHIGEYMRANWSGIPDQLPRCSRRSSTSWSARRRRRTCRSSARR